MKTLKRSLMLLLALCMIFSLAACGGGSAAKAPEEAPAAEDNAEAAPAEEAAEPEAAAEEAPAAAPAEAGKRLEGKTIGYVTISSSAPWGGRVGTELERMAKEEGAKVYVLDAQTDMSKIAQYCQQMIDDEVDALCVFGGVTTETAKAAYDAGIPLFLCNQDVSEDAHEYAIACIGPDQEEAFYDIGQYIIDENGADAGSLVLYINGVPFLDDYIQRMAGFDRAMAETNYDVKEPQDAYSDRTVAKTFMEQWIQAYGDDIAIVVGSDDDLTMGAVQAIDEAGMTGSIKVYSFTGQNDAIQAVADGKISMTVMNRADAISQETIEAMVEYFSTGSTEYFHRTSLTYITAENAADYIGQGEF